MRDPPQRLASLCQIGSAGLVPGERWPTYWCSRCPVAASIGRLVSPRRRRISQRRPETAEPWFGKPKVGGSNPSPGTRKDEKLASYVRNYREQPTVTPIAGQTSGLTGVGAGIGEANKKANRRTRRSPTPSRETCAKSPIRPARASRGERWLLHCT